MSQAKKNPFFFVSLADDDNLSLLLPTRRQWWVEKFLFQSKFSSAAVQFTSCVDLVVDRPAPCQAFGVLNASRVKHFTFLFTKLTHIAILYQVDWTTRNRGATEIRNWSINRLTNCWIKQHMSAFIMLQGSHRLEKPQQDNYWSERYVFSKANNYRL